MEMYGSSRRRKSGIWLTSGNRRAQPQQAYAAGSASSGPRHAGQTNRIASAATHVPREFAARPRDVEGKAPRKRSGERREEAPLVRGSSQPPRQDERQQR